MMKNIQAKGWNRFKNIPPPPTPKRQVYDKGILNVYIEPV